MYSRELSALLKSWTPTSNLTVLPACLRILLNLLLSCPSASFPSMFAGFRWCCWLGCCCSSGCPLSLLGRDGTFHFGNFFKLSAGSTFHLARPAWPAGLSLPGYQSFERCSLASEVSRTSSQ